MGSDLSSLCATEFEARVAESDKLRRERASLSGGGSQEIIIRKEMVFKVERS